MTHPLRLVMPGQDALLLVIGRILDSEPVLAVVRGTGLVVRPRLRIVIYFI